MLQRKGSDVKLKLKALLSIVQNSPVVAQYLPNQLIFTFLWIIKCSTCTKFTFTCMKFAYNLKF